MADRLNPSHHQIATHLIDSIISDMTAYLMEDFGYSIEEALDTIYSSKLLTLLTTEESELYLQSASYNYELLMQEKELIFFH